MALDQVEFKKHSGNISYFREHFIKTGIFEVELSSMISIASEARANSDYDDFYVISKEDVNELIDDSALFLSNIKAYLVDRNIFEEV